MLKFENYHTGGGCMALRAECPGSESPSGYVLVTDEYGSEVPKDMETETFVIGAYAFEDDEGKTITVQGRTGLNDWHLENVGYRPDDDAGQPLAISDLVAMVAEMFFYHSVPAKVIAPTATVNSHVVAPISVQIESAPIVTIDDRYADSIIGDQAGRFEALEVHGVRDMHEPDHPHGTCIEIDNDNPQFFAVYTRIKPSVGCGLECVGDFSSHDLALKYAQDLAAKYEWPIHDYVHQLLKQEIEQSSAEHCVLRLSLSNTEKKAILLCLGNYLDIERIKGRDGIGSDLSNELKRLEPVLESEATDIDLTLTNLALLRRALDLHSESGIDETHQVVGIDAAIIDLIKRIDCCTDCFMPGGDSNRYTHQFMSMCPVNGKTIFYTLDIHTTRMIKVEEITAVSAKCHIGYHEAIADEFLKTFGGKQRLSAYHHGVHIKTIRRIGQPA